MHVKEVWEGLWEETVGSHNLVFPAVGIQCRARRCPGQAKGSTRGRGASAPYLFPSQRPIMVKRMESMAKQKMGFDDVPKPPAASV